ncbi:hypothetical protein CROQUDRAFT_68892 [Cronartium quercuum f. sp. fusiforme G11]|uniref:Purine-cytosine permease n=1 Tax=Cronartium quercuum f. sp. fusiforme G11 TaxID=708437 RepID=A0A9P6N8F8_9BASI|nr:hypothetical protein CROQUDRAFT_68892 [Cronartium quercuum f. sp. fusiforme G11]
MSKDLENNVHQQCGFTKSANISESKEYEIESKAEDHSDPSWIRRLRDLISKWGLEVNGIERIPSEARTQQSIFDVFTMWLAANCNVSTFSLGTLSSSVFKLGLRHSILAIVFFNMFAVIPVAYCSSFGARSGLRQMVFSRFAFGYWTCMIPGILNVIACVGWGTINCIVGAQSLHTVSNTHPLPIWAGIIIIAILTLIPSFCGYKYVYFYERYSWLAPAIVFLIILGESHKFMKDAPTEFLGKSKIASIFSFGASVVGYSLSWVSYAADYTVHLPENSSSWKIFFAAFFGNMISLVLIEILGAAMMSTLSVQLIWKAEYESNGIGGLLGAGLSPLKGFGGFLTAILGLSVVGANIPILYSLALTVQIFGNSFAVIPRAFITLAGTAVCVTLSLIGASRFVSLLDTLLVFLSYWSIIYCSILVEEHLIFRRGLWSKYDWSEIDRSDLLPRGFASALALCFGIVGAVLGMSQKWYIGRIGHMVGTENSDGDIGFELSFLFTCLTYPPLRYLEKQRFGR